MDVRDWLNNLGLGKYEEVFVANAIDTDVLRELTEADFEKLGARAPKRRNLPNAAISR
jgi:hypothetical protein